MEIISYTLESELAHKGTLGNVKTISPDEAQRMSADTGVQHSEFNHAKDQTFEPQIMPRPVEVEKAVPFAQDLEHAAYAAAAMHRWWRALAQVDRVFKRFRSSFLGKQSPVHFFWGSFDLAVIRSSGRAAPRHAGGVPNCPDNVMVEAYPHECSSAGFWPGGGAVDEAAFHAYAYPEPAGYPGQAVQPFTSTLGE